MSYEKYLKYKTKYLNLKNKIQNIQKGGNLDINSLGTTPISDYSQNNMKDSDLLQKLLGGGHNEEHKEHHNEKHNEHHNEKHNEHNEDNEHNKEKELPDNLTETPKSEEQKGGSKKVYKRRIIKRLDSESDSDLDSDSSMLSFNSDSLDSDDEY